MSPINYAFWLCHLVITAMTLLVVLVHGREACYSITVTVFIHTPFVATSFPPCVSMSLSHPLAFLLLVFLTHTLPLPSLSLCLSPLFALLPLTHFTEVHPLKHKHSYPLCRLVAFIHALAVWGGRTPQVMDGTTSRLSDSTLCSVWRMNANWNY